LALQKIREFCTESTVDAIQVVLNAAQFVAIKHAGQKRKGEAAEPYVNHLIEVAGLVSGAITEPDTN
jgi:(p)ppGpp synthase/HD superfamily hydrolase